MATPITRRFGPTLAPGVAIVEQLGAREITPGVLGTTLHFGIFERGMVGEVNRPMSESHFNRIGGDNISESLAPDAAQDFYAHSEGAGEFNFIRVTDGTEVKAQRDFYDRTDISAAAGLFASEDRNLVVRIRAKNGGRWAGREKVLADEHAGVGALTETTLTTGLTMLLNEYAGAELSLGQVPSTTYTVVSNTTTGIITVSSDSTMLTDFGGGGNNEWEVVLGTVADKNVEILMKDGIDDADLYFGMEVKYKNTVVLNYDNLSLDPDDQYYFVTVINNDVNNHEVEAVGGLFTGAYVAARRPANHFGYIDALTPTKLTFQPYQYSVVSPTGANPTVNTLTGVVGTIREDTLTGTVGGAGTTISWTSTFIDDLPTETIGVPYAAKNIYTIGWTTTNGGTPLADGDVITINVFPLRVDQHIGGVVVFEDGSRIRITDNGVDNLDVSTATDLTSIAAVGETFRVESFSRLHGGYDGHDGVTDGDYTALMDPSTSVANSLFEDGKGLIKLAAPGVTSATVNIAGKDYAEAKNAQWRYEVAIANQPSEIGFDTWVRANLERSDYAVLAYNSQVYVPDPVAPLLKKLVSATGMIHGREARVAISRGGYHKAAAGVSVTLPRIVELKSDELNRPIDEEFLNPRGYQMLKPRQGDHIIWGDRTLWVNRTWMFKHQREQMSYYEETLRLNFDDTIFEINDQSLWELLKARIRTFFRVEFAKRALYSVDGKFDSAFRVKIDSQNNTTATLAAGDLNAEISLSLANTVERFIITMGKKGVFTAIGS